MAFATPALVQATTLQQVNQQNASVSASFGTTPVAGNMIEVAGSVWNYGDLPSYISSISDNQGNSYDLVELETGDNDNCFVFKARAYNVNAGGTFTVTINFLQANNANAATWQAAEFENLKAAPIDDDATGVSGGTDTSVATDSTGTLDQTHELLTLAVGGLAPGGLGLPSTWTLIGLAQRTSDGGQPMPGFLYCYKTVTATTAVNATVAHSAGSGAALLHTYEAADELSNDHIVLDFDPAKMTDAETDMTGYAWEFDPSTCFAQKFLSLAGDAVDGKVYMSPAPSTAAHGASVAAVIFHATKSSPWMTGTVVKS